MPNYGLFFMKTYLLHPDICGHHLILLILVYYEAKWDIHVKESNKRRGGDSALSICLHIFKTDYNIVHCLKHYS